MSTTQQEIRQRPELPQHKSKERDNIQRVSYEQEIETIKRALHDIVRRVERLKVSGLSGGQNDLTIR